MNGKMLQLIVNGIFASDDYNFCGFSFTQIGYNSDMALIVSLDNPLMYAENPPILFIRFDALGLPIVS